MSEVIDIAENILCVGLEKLRATLAVSGQGKLLQMQHSKTAEKQRQQSSLPTNVLHCIGGGDAGISLSHQKPGTPETL